ncbi:hypothetical protein FYK55_09525 [Roseiconus nitratireducens]|uniref:Uncharacterized protein n=1 Tax=Roseiconus nitratireducens TaxID=2605748 RepID=A0A5M6DAI4_9BACT|nr:hypothetical protein [Roseiconus nitratireducens]KAA5544551.1 hypothetical protein FYK55_09525 [Roseiconus nitratireducens]
METISQEQILAIGITGLVIIGVAMVVTLAVMAGTLKLCIALIGNRNPSYLACIGWLIAIGFMNAFIVTTAWSVFGRGAVLLATPLTWFVTLYLISTAADCGLLRAFGIWFANSILGTIGLIAVMFVMSIPLAMFGANMEGKMKQIKSQMQTAQNAASQQEGPFDPDLASNPRDGGSQSGAASGGGLKKKTEQPDISVVRHDAVSKANATTTDAVTKQQRATVPKPRPMVKAKPRPTPRPAIKRAPDGTQLNPFFQN